MPNVIQIKRSTTTATPPSLAAGELAYSEASDTLFIGSNAGAVIAIAGSGQFLLTSQLLTQIKNVDGSGSGIDSDLLDGQEGTYYRNAGNLNAGLLPAACFNDTSHGARGGGNLHANASGSINGFMSSADKTKLDGIASGANNYSLPTASNTVLGGVKSGGDVTISGTGVVSVNDDSHNHTVANIDGLQTELDDKFSKTGGTITGSVIITGDATIQGDFNTTTGNVVDLGDNIIVLNSGETGTPSVDAGIEVERGTSANVQWVWDEAADNWSAKGQRIGGVADPITNDQVGGRGYNDSRYASINHSHAYDNYGNWTISIDGGTASNVGSGNNVNFIGGSNVTLSKSGNAITINAAGTTYTQGTGISISGQTIALANHSASFITSGTLSDARLSSNVLKAASTIDGGTF
jgi:hypothetical protein